LGVTQQQVLEALAKVASPRGVALTNANVLSPVTVTDGKVFFSINVDATEARAWESVRAQAEAAVRAIPGVTVAMNPSHHCRRPATPSSSSSTSCNIHSMRPSLGRRAAAARERPHIPRSRRPLPWIGRNRRL